MQARAGKKQRHLDVRKILLHFLRHAQRTRRGNAPGGACNDKQKEIQNGIDRCYHCVCVGVGGGGSKGEQEHLKKTKLFDVVGIGTTPPSAVC